MGDLKQRRELGRANKGRGDKRERKRANQKRKHTAVRQEKGREKASTQAQGTV